MRWIGIAILFVSPFSLAEDMVRYRAIPGDTLSKIARCLEGSETFTAKGRVAQLLEWNPELKDRPQWKLNIGDWVKVKKEFTTASWFTSDNSVGFIKDRSCTLADTPKGKRSIASTPAKKDNKDIVIHHPNYAEPIIIRDSQYSQAGGLHIHFHDHRQPEVKRGLASTPQMVEAYGLSGAKHTHFPQIDGQYGYMKIDSKAANGATAKVATQFMYTLHGQWDWQWSDSWGFAAGARFSTLQFDPPDNRNLNRQDWWGLNPYTQVYYFLNPNNKLVMKVGVQQSFGFIASATDLDIEKVNVLVAGLGYNYSMDIGNYVFESEIVAQYLNSGDNGSVQLESGFGGSLNLSIARRFRQWRVGFHTLTEYQSQDTNLLTRSATTLGAGFFVRFQFGEQSDYRGLSSR